MKKKFREQAEKRHSTKDHHNTDKVHPQEQARRALVDGHFSSKERDEFFDKVFGDIMVDYFDQWLQTASHETKTREFLYEAAMALGDVKRKLLQYETYGRNAELLVPDPSDTKGDE